MSEHSYHHDRLFQGAEQHRFTPGNFTPLKEYEAFSRASYTPLASTTEPGEISLRNRRYSSWIQDSFYYKLNPQQLFQRERPFSSAHSKSSWQSNSRKKAETYFELRHGWTQVREKKNQRQVYPRQQYFEPGKSIWIKERELSAFPPVQNTPTALRKKCRSTKANSVEHSSKARTISIGVQLPWEKGKKRKSLV